MVFALKLSGMVVSGMRLGVGFGWIGIGGVIR
jgi:hypothetical protein